MSLIKSLKDGNPAAITIQTDQRIHSDKYLYLKDCLNSKEELQMFLKIYLNSSLA